MKQLINSFTGEIVDYYDMYFLPHDKVQNECSYIMDICTPYIEKYDSLLDVGCGTGAHAQMFSKYFKNVKGIDISQDMINYAKLNHTGSNIDYECMDIRKNCNHQKENDIVVSIAHVIGYQLDNQSIENYFLSINRMLKYKGILFLNFYNQPALYLNKMESRFTKIDKNGISILRFSNASLEPEKNCLNLDYYYIIEKDKDIVTSYEVHERMRYFTCLEIEYFLYKNGFESVKFLNYHTKEKLTPDVWNGGVLARKIIQK